MSTMINPTDRTTPAIYLINTMTREVKRNDLLEHFRIKHVEGQEPSVNVELKINGVEVDFEKSITEMWERLQSSYDEDVLRVAKELLSQTRFDKLNDLLRDAEWKIEEELTALFRDKQD